MDARILPRRIASQRIRFVQPRAPKFSCPFCLHKRYSSLKGLSKHCRNKKEPSHQKLAEATSRLSCRLCLKEFSRPNERCLHEATHSILVNTQELEYLPPPQIKLNSFDSSEDILVSFYIHRLAPSRTLSKAQDLYIESLQMSQSFSYLRNSIRSLSASYLKHRFTKSMSLSWRIDALSELQECLNHVKQDNLREMKAILGCTAILIQYTVKTPNLHQEWCDMVRGLGPLLGWAIPFIETLPYRMRLAAHYVLANTVATSGQQFPSPPFLSESEQGIQEIDGSVCASPQMLHTIQTINLLKNKFEARDLALKVRKIQQLSSEPGIDQDARDVIIKTAVTFRLGTLEYINCRFHGIFEDVEMQTIRNELLQTIENLPLHGRLYTAMHNLWGIFFCAVGTNSRRRLSKILNKLEYNLESNISPVLKLISQHIWATKAVYWEEIISKLPPTSLT